MAKRATAGYSIRNVIIVISSKCRSLVSATQRTLLAGAGSDVAGDGGTAGVRIGGVRRAEIG